MIVSGVVENLIYRNADNGYTVLELEAPKEAVTVAGVLPCVAEGEEIEVEGDFTLHPTYGRQFVATSFTSRLPVTETAILRYLSSGIIRGVRAKKARAIVEKFGPETLEIMENDPSRLVEIRGISMEQAEKISASLRENTGVKSILMYFRGFGITPNLAFKIYKQWGLRAYDILRENPYRLCEIHGIGFERADAIAEQMNYDRASTNRVEAGILYVLNYNLYGSGHTFLPRAKLAQIAASLLSVEPETVMRRMDEMAEAGLLTVRNPIGNTDGVYLTWVDRCEEEVADRVLFASAFRHEYSGDFEKDIGFAQTALGISFAERQKQAILDACRHQMMILSGGPGTGKTTTLNGIIRMFENEGVTFAIAAPTGRAAKRVTELTGKEAKTLHRLLEYRPEGGEFVFGRNRDNLLEYQAVIVDEASMVDLPLFAHLLEALPRSSKLILVGDAAQLPPVGPGKIFKDISDSGLIPFVELKEIFRQAKESRIVRNAHRILEGETPDLTNRTGDFFFLDRRDPERIAETVCELCATRLPDAYGFDPQTDIQVLSPTRKGSSGTVTLNAALAETLNPPEKYKKEMKFRGITFREGDKVMQTRNNYEAEAVTDGGETETGIFNGDIGIVCEVSPRGETLTVRFDDRRVTYTPDMLEDLEPAYAVTVHKSQGSEFPAVVLVLGEGTDLLFTRNLLYTAVTRARRLLVVVGYPYRVSQMVASVRSDKRYSGLKYRILDKMKEAGIS